MLFSYLYTLFSLPVLVAQWIGVLAFRRGPRGVSWMLMLWGVIIGSLTPLYPFISMFFQSRMISGAYGMNYWMIYLPSMVALFSSGLFFIGFALHGLKAARTAERQGELEQLAAAMAEEIDRLKGNSRI